jgi:hypothetical protein
MVRFESISPIAVCLRNSFTAGVLISIQSVDTGGGRICEPHTRFFCSLPAILACEVSFTFWSEKQFSFEEDAFRAQFELLWSHTVKQGEAWVKLG